MLMLTTRQLRALTIAAAITAGALVASCNGSDDEASPNEVCQTNIATSTSPTTGALTLMGDFFSDESVILRSSKGTYTGTPSTNRSSFTLTGLPSGTDTYSVTISCDAGQDSRGSRNFTVQ